MHGHSTTFTIHYSTTDHRYHAYDATGGLLGSGWTHADAIRAAGMDPEEEYGPSEEGGEGGPNPDADDDSLVARLTRHVATTYAAVMRDFAADEAQVQTLALSDAEWAACLIEATAIGARGYSEGAMR